MRKIKEHLIMMVIAWIIWYMLFNFTCNQCEIIDNEKIILNNQTLIISDIHNIQDTLKLWEVE